MSGNSKITSRRKGTICHHIVVAILFFALFFVRPPQTSSVMTSIDYSHLGQNSPSQRTLIITAYNEIVDDRYISLDYLGSILRGIDITKSDIILINNSMSQTQQSEVFDKAMFEYLAIDNKYTNIIAVNDASMPFAIEAKHMYFPEANIFCFNQTNTDNENLKLVKEYHPEVNSSQYASFYLNETQQFELLKTQVNATLDGAFTMYPDKNNIVLVADNEDYSLDVIDIIMDNERLSGMGIQILNVNSIEVNDIDYYNSIVLYTVYPKTIKITMNMLCATQMTACFDLSADVASDSSDFIRPLRLFNYYCDHDPIILQGGNVSSAEYISKDSLEKALMSCVGLNSADLAQMGIDAVDTAHFISYGLTFAGVTDFGSDVKTQIDTCLEKNLLTPRSQLELGNLIYYSDAIYPDIQDVSNVQVYFGYETVLHVDQNGRVVCSKPVDDLYHNFYANVNLLLDFDNAN